MDQNEEFEMKPLTPGLGFHKKPVSLKEHIAKVGMINKSMRPSIPLAPPPEVLADQSVRSSKQIIDELHQALRPVTSQVRLSETLPRDLGEISSPAPEFERPVRRPTDGGELGKINFQIPDKTIADGKSTGTRRGAHDNLVRPLAPVSVSFSSIALDATIVLAVSLIFLISLIMVTGVDLVAVVRSSTTEVPTQLSLFVLYLAIYAMYLIVARSFFGRSLGEWTFDLQMGDDKVIEAVRYPALVLWRSLLVLLTGLVALPLLSLIMGRDIAAGLTGLQLYRRN